MTVDRCDLYPDPVEGIVTSSYQKGISFAMYRVSDVVDVKERVLRAPQFRRCVELLCAIISSLFPKLSILKLKSTGKLPSIVKHVDRNIPPSIQRPFPPSS
jgi:hypothetical protein